MNVNFKDGNNMGIIENRRSIRKYKNQKVEKEKIEAILLAGLQAPSPKNRQPWRFVIISDENKRKDLATKMRNHISMHIKENAYREDINASLETIDIIEQAPVLILVCYEYGMVQQHDDGVNWQIAARDLEAVELQAIGAAVENMLLKAEELGIGSLWCGDILYAYEIVSQFSTRPVVSAVCLGYKNEMPINREKKKISEMCVFY